MGTLADLKARIAGDLVRSDLTAQIAAAIPDAIRVAAASRFHFNEVRGLTFNTVAGQEFYGSAALADIPYLTAIDACWIVVNGQRRTLRETTTDYLDRLLEGSPTNGEPYLYARHANGIRIHSIPDRVYPVYIDGLTRFAPLTDDTQSNAWTDEGEYLIRTLVKAYLNESPIDNPEAADRMFARYEQIKRDLMAEATGRHASGSMAAWGC